MRRMEEKPGHKVGIAAWWSKIYAKQAKQLPRRERQLNWLKRANDKKRIYLQIEGGVKYDKDLRELVKLGLLSFKRAEYDGIQSTWYKGNKLSRAYLEITVKGLEALENGRL